MHKFVGKNQQNHSFQCKNTCMKHKFGNFTYEYYLKGKLSFFCSLFLKLLLYHLHGVHDRLIFNIVHFKKKHHIVKN